MLFVIYYPAYEDIKNWTLFSNIKVIEKWNIRWTGDGGTLDIYWDLYVKKKMANLSI